MKIKDIIGGTKKRTNRDPRKRRIVQKSLYDIKASDLGEAFGRSNFAKQLKKSGIDVDKMHADNVKDAKDAKKRSASAQKDLDDFRKKHNLKEAKGRDINHIEDLVIFYGKQGGMKAINSLRSLQTNPSDTTIKWDGSPAVIFGRDDQGDFILTDKSGFGAKGYDGKVKSPQALQQMFMNRKIKDPSKTQERKEFAERMAGIWPAFESATPEDFRGYIAGDLMYTETPTVKDGRLVFQPNTTMYSVAPNSDMGQKIANSKVGVTVHVYIDSDGNKSKPDTTNFQAGDLLILPPVSPNIPGQVKDYDKELASIEQMINSSGNSIDEITNPPKELKMADFQNMLYTYVNNAVKTGESQFGKQFMDWVKNNDKISGVKKQRVVDWSVSNKDGFTNLWKVFNAIMNVKDKIIAHLDDQEADIEAYTGGKRGGEGYVVGKDAKLVNRREFTATNAKRER